MQGWACHALMHEHASHATDMHTATLQTLSYAYLCPATDNEELPKDAKKDRVEEREKRGGEHGREQRRAVK